MARAGSSGGDRRARHVFAALAARTAASVTTAHGRRGLPRLWLAIGFESAAWRRSLRLASAQLVPDAGLAAIRGPVSAEVIDLHDHPVLQADSLGVDLDAGTRDRLARRFSRNVATFRWLVVPSRSFAELCGLPADRVQVVVNGTDPTLIGQHPASAEPVVAMASGAAPRRGIEALIEAVGVVRERVPEASLRLALTATGPASATYLADLRAARREPWVAIADVPDTGLDAFLAQAAVLVVPHPPGDYMDVATPVKLFDSMAAGRPVVVTPRLETRRIVEAAQAGLVASSDATEDLAAAIATLLLDEPRRRELGDNARRAAVMRYDWRVLSAALADAVLGPDRDVPT